MIIKERDVKYTDGIDNVNTSSFSHPWSKSLVEEDLKNPNSFYAIGIENERVVAYAGMTVIAGEANLTNIAVLPEERQKGLGEKLLAHLLEACAKKKFSLITLEVRKSNFPAISLYSRFGFETEGERKKYYSDNGEDALIMTKRF